MASPYTGIPHAVTLQKLKTDTYNEDIDQLDGQINGPLSVVIDGDTTLTDAQFNFYQRFELTPETSLAADFTLYVPANARDFKVKNETGFIATVRVTGDVGAAEALADGGGIIGLYCDGTDVEVTSGGAGGGVIRNVTVTPPWRGARIRKSADETGADYSAGATVSWGTTVRDTDGIVSGNALVAPADATKVILRANIVVTNANLSSDLIYQFQKSLSDFDDSATARMTKASSDALGVYIESGVLDVAGGESYTTKFFALSDNSITIKAAQSWFELEVVETDEAAYPPEPVDMFFSAAHFGGALPTSGILFRKVASRRFSLADDFADSQGATETAPGSDVVLDVEVEGSKIGEVTIAGTTGAVTFTTTSTVAEDVEIGETFDVMAPSNWNSADEIALAFYAWRS